MTTALDRRTALYRFYDANDMLLYVGISCQPKVRFTQHAADKAWWPQVARTDVVWHDDRPSAAAAEAKAILDESPLWNIATPDEDGRYTIGTGRPVWQVTTDEQRELLARLDEIVARRAKLWDAIERARTLGVPKNVIARHAKPAVSRATLYRRLGETDPDGEEGASTS